MIKSLFRRQPPALMGLDVSASSIKLVELGQDASGNHVLECCGIEPLQQDWVSEGAIEYFDEVVQACKDLIRKSGARAKQVAMALPSSVVISKRVVLPADLSAAEMEIQAEVEASQYIPFPLDEVSLDFCVMGVNAYSSEDVDVMIAAARKEKVEEFQGLAEAVGLVPAVIEVDSYAARRAALQIVDQLPTEQQQITALFQLGGLTSSLQVMRGEESLYERELMFGGYQLTQQLVRQYGFSLKEAETKKRTGDLPADYAEDVLAPFVQTLSRDIEGALQFFFTSTPYNRVDAIALAGGSATLMGLAAAVEERTSSPCATLNPFEGMHVARTIRVERLQREAPSYLTACGLALRRFAL